MWKAKLLSRAGKLTLLKSVLNNLPLYYLSIFRIPKMVAKKIIGIQRRFLWQGDCNNKGMSLVKWDTVEMPKEWGGLGVGNLLTKNIALLLKWWWRYTKEDETLWKKIVMSVEEITGKKASLECFQNSKVGIWKDIAGIGHDDTMAAKIVEEI